MTRNSIDTNIPTLGDAKISSPNKRLNGGNQLKNFISDDDRIIVNLRLSDIKTMIKKGDDPPCFEMAGPREKIYFDPSKLKCALVTCGGLCPGLNDIIRSIVLELYYGYGVRNIVGIRYGLQGFIPEFGHDVIDLTPDFVCHILDMGGSVLGSSRGPQKIDEIVDSLEMASVKFVNLITDKSTSSS